MKILFIFGFTIFSINTFAAHLNKESACSIYKILEEEGGKEVFTKKVKERLLFSFRKAFTENSVDYPSMMNFSLLLNVITDHYVSFYAPAWYTNQQGQTLMLDIDQSAKTNPYKIPLLNLSFFVKVLLDRSGSITGYKCGLSHQADAVFVNSNYREQSFLDFTFPVYFVHDYPFSLKKR